MAQEVKILVVDDEDVVLQSVQKILKNGEHYSFHIDIALSAEQGILLAEVTPYDLIIIDLVMPGMDGMEMLEKLKELDYQAKIIMFTGYAKMQTALKALRKGALDFIAKPFTKKELLSSINRALQSKQKETKSDEDNADSKTASTTEKYQNGQIHNMREHTWVRMDDDQNVTIGVDKEFLVGIEKIKSINLVVVGEELIQGQEFCKITDSHDAVHILRAPLSGIVTEHNERALKDYSIIHEQPISEGWLLRIELS